MKAHHLQKEEVTHRQSLVLAAHGLFILVVILLILEAIWIDRFLSHRESIKLGMTLYCTLIIGAIQSCLFLLRGRSLWHWAFALLLLFLYSAITIPEGVDDFQQIANDLASSYRSRPKMAVQLTLILSFLIPLIAFVRLLITDIRLAAADRKVKASSSAPDSLPTTTTSSDQDHGTKDKQSPTEADRPGLS